MNITLRKANTLQEAIGEFVKSMELNFTVDLNEYASPADVITNYAESLVTADKTRMTFLSMQYEIRGLIGAAKSKSGIDLKLTMLAYMDSRIKQITPMINLEKIAPIAEVEGKLEKIRKRPPEVQTYGMSDTVTTSVVTPEFIKQITEELKLLKRQRQKLSDDILETNIGVTIPIPDHMIEPLTNAGLL